MSPFLCRLWAAALTLPLAGAAAPATLVFDPASSRIDIAIQSTLDSFVAHIRSFESTVIIDRATGRVIAARFRAPFTAIQTGFDDRDRNMNAWQDTVRFPEITFELKAIAPTPDGGYSARGTLRLHGRAREETLALRIGADAGGLAIDGTAVLDTRNYGLPIFRKFWVLTVNPVVRVRFHLRGSWAPVDRSGRGGT